MTRAVACLLAVSALLAAAPARAQQPAALEAQWRTTAEDVDAMTERLERLVALKEKGALSDADLDQLEQKLIAAHESVVVTGELKDVPLSEALDAVLAAVRAAPRRGLGAPNGPSLVARPVDLLALAEVHVSASFAGTRAADAMRALLRSQDASETLGIELSEEGDVFVVAVHRYSDAEDREGVMQVDPQPMIEEEEDGEGVPGYLGVGGGTNPGPKVLVVSVEPGSPAELAGLRIGDEVTAIDGVEVKSWEQLRALIRAHRAGDDVVLDVTRGAQRMRVLVTLGQSR